MVGDTVFLNNKQNRRILNGFFPTGPLHPVNFDIANYFNYRDIIEEQIALLEENSGFLGLFLSAINNKTRVEYESLSGSNKYIDEINCFINAGRHPDTLLFEGSYKRALNLFPVATALDKCLWLAAEMYLDLVSAKNTEEDIFHRNVAYAFVYLLNKTQEAEFKTRKTIYLSKELYKISLTAVIDNGFDSLDSIYLIDLSNKEKEDLERIISEREKLSFDIEREDQASKEIAKTTNWEWKTFLQIFNDLSKRRNKTIATILSDSSLAQKKETVRNYKSVLSKIERGVYFLNKSEINLLTLFDKINDRLYNAPCSAFVCLKNKEPFRLHPLAPVLIVHPFGFDHLLIMFHDFRLNNSSETANSFFSTALECIERNLSFSLSKNLSFMDRIIRFKDIVFEYVDKNKEKIESLSFDDIQDDNIAIGSDSILSLESSDIFNQKFVDQIKDFEGNPNNELLERFLLGEIKPMNVKQVNALEKQTLDSLNEADNTVRASRIISSLNIIYLFCEALRMTISLGLDSELIDSAVLSQIRHDLLSLDDWLIHLVYSNIDKNKIGMIEYRESKGIDARLLTEQEAREERDRNQTFSVILKDSIDKIIENINSNDIDQIINSKKEIQKEIFSCPNCLEKEQFAMWLDSVTEKLCNALIENVKSKKDDFLLVRDRIISSLGTPNLPSPTVDSLATAEILYERYANVKYAEEGFDFSCISSLYYQAFEDAYNRLIWKDYANYLNTPQGTNPAFADCLDLYRYSNITDTNLMGYLFDTNPKQRGYYIDYGNRTTQTTIKEFCMYKPFGILMDQVKQNSRMIHFHNYISVKFGFRNSSELFGNSTFMAKVNQFTINVLASADNRNNASHGGTIITRIQCENDKNAVIDNLKQIRENNIGLIQQLMYLCFSRK